MLLATSPLACTPVITGTWTIEETTVKADFIGCDQEHGQQTATAFDLGTFMLFDDGTYQVESRYDIVISEVYVRWPFDPLNPAVVTEGHWTPDEQFDQIRIEDHTVLGFLGGWNYSLVGDELLLSGLGGGTIFEPCGSDSKSVTHRLSRQPIDGPE